MTNGSIHKKKVTNCKYICTLYRSTYFTPTLTDVKGESNNAINSTGLQYHPPWGQRGDMLGDGPRIPGYVLPDTDLPVSGVKPLFLPLTFSTLGARKQTALPSPRSGNCLSV